VTVTHIEPDPFDREPGDDEPDPEPDPHDRPDGRAMRGSP